MVLRQPAETFSPGEILRDELEARGWTQADLAHIIDQPAGMIAQIIAGNHDISPKTAQDLATAFETTAEFWMNLDATYQVSRVSRGGAGEYD